MIMKYPRIPYVPVKFFCKKLNFPPEPTNCCMSGCANCVWIAYAQEMTKILGDDGKTAEEIILKNVVDPNVRSFLLMELKTMSKES